MKKLNTKAHIHLTRKLMHLFVGLVLTIILYRFDEDWVKPLIYGITGLGIMLEFLRLKSSTFNDWVLKKVHLFARKEESKKLSGLSYYFIGTSTALFLVSPKTLSLLTFILALGDPLAAYIGRKWGKVHYRKNKTIEGSTLLLLLSFICVVFFHFNVMPIPYFLVLPIIITFTEAFPFLDDNFSMLFFPSLGIYLFSL